MLRAGAKEGGLFVSMSFFMDSLMLLAAIGDLRMMLRGGVFGSGRGGTAFVEDVRGVVHRDGFVLHGTREQDIPSVFPQSGWL
jgi:hypothetical protein